MASDGVHQCVGVNAGSCSRGHTLNRALLIYKGWFRLTHFKIIMHQFFWLLNTSWRMKPIYKMTETEKDVQNYWGKTTASLKIARLPEVLIGIQIGVQSCKPHTYHNFLNTNAYCGWTQIFCFVAFFLAAESSVFFVVAIARTQWRKNFQKFRKWGIGRQRTNYC